MSSSSSPLIDDIGLTGARSTLALSRLVLIAYEGIDCLWKSPPLTAIGKRCLMHPVQVFSPGTPATPYLTEQPMHTLDLRPKRCLPSRTRGYCSARLLTARCASYRYRLRSIPRLPRPANLA